MLRVQGLSRRRARCLPGGAGEQRGLKAEGKCGMAAGETQVRVEHLLPPPTSASTSPVEATEAMREVAGSLHLPLPAAFAPGDGPSSLSAATGEETNPVGLGN